MWLRIMKIGCLNCRDAMKGIDSNVACILEIVIFITIMIVMFRWLIEKASPRSKIVK